MAVLRWHTVTETLKNLWNPEKKRLAEVSAYVKDALHLEEQRVGALRVRQAAKGVLMLLLLKIVVALVAPTTLGPCSFPNPSSLLVLRCIALLVTVLLHRCGSKLSPRNLFILWNVGTMVVDIVENRTAAPNSWPEFYMIPIYIIASTSLSFSWCQQYLVIQVVFHLLSPFLLLSHLLPCQGFPYQPFLSTLMLTTFPAVISWLAARTVWNNSVDKHIAQESARVASIRNDDVIYKLLPPHVVQKLKDGERFIAESEPQAVILFCRAHWVGERLDNVAFFEQQGQLYGMFDSLVDGHGLHTVERLHTAYMVAGGLAWQDNQGKAVTQCVRLAQHMQQKASQLQSSWELQIGIHKAPAVGTVIGKSPRFHFTLLSASVNTACRLMTTGERGRLHVSEFVVESLRQEHSAPMDSKPGSLIGSWRVEDLGLKEFKGCGTLRTSWIEPSASNGVAKSVVRSVSLSDDQVDDIVSLAASKSKEYSSSPALMRNIVEANDVEEDDPGSWTKGRKALRLPHSDLRASCVNDSLSRQQLASEFHVDNRRGLVAALKRRFALRFKSEQSEEMFQAQKWKAASRSAHAVAVSMWCYIGFYALMVLTTKAEETVQYHNLGWRRAMTMWWPLSCTTWVLATSLLVRAAQKEQLSPRFQPLLQGLCFAAMLFPLSAQAYSLVNVGRGSWAYAPVAIGMLSSFLYVMQISFPANVLAAIFVCTGEASFLLVGGLVMDFLLRWSCFLVLISVGLGMEADCEKDARATFLFQERVQLAHGRTSTILRSLLPVAFVEAVVKAQADQSRQRLMGKPNHISQCSSTTMTILQLDICGFSDTCKRFEPREVAIFVNTLFGGIDTLLESYPTLFKLFTVGDAYIVAGGMPPLTNSTPQDVCMLAIEILRLLPHTNKSLREEIGKDFPPITVRMGIAHGTMTVGVLNPHEKPVCAAMGHALTRAEVLEQSGVANHIHISGRTLLALDRETQYHASKLAALSPTRPRTESFSQQLTDSFQRLIGRVSPSPSRHSGSSLEGTRDGLRVETCPSVESVGVDQTLLGLPRDSIATGMADRKLHASRSFYHRGSPSTNYHGSMTISDLRSRVRSAESTKSMSRALSIPVLHVERSHDPPQGPSMPASVANLAQLRWRNHGTLSGDGGMTVTGMGGMPSHSLEEVVLRPRILEETFLLEAPEMLVG